MSELFHNSAEDYGNKYRDHMFEQYKLYVDSADRISQRRTSTNTFLLTVNASLVTLYGIAAPLKPVGLTAWRVLVPIAGVLVCIAWLGLIESYRNLNTAKFTVIHELEQRLPTRLYKHEWTLLDKGKGNFYKPVSHIEQWIPVIFILLYVGLIVYPLLS